MQIQLGSIMALSRVCLASCGLEPSPCHDGLVCRDGWIPAAQEKGCMVKGVFLWESWWQLPWERVHLQGGIFVSTSLPYRICLSLCPPPGLWN